MSMIINPYLYGGSPPSSALYDLIVADIAASTGGYYFRHAEASGAVMENEVGSDGAYNAGVTLGSPALYPTGPTSVRLPNSGGSGYGIKIGGTSPAFNELTIFGIVKFDSALSGFKGLICYDDGGSIRKWQLRTNGTALDFVKIQGGVDTKSFAVGFVNGNTYAIGISIDSSGNFLMNVNGSSVLSTTIGTTDYGSASEFIEIGRCAGGGGIPADSFFSESTIFGGFTDTTRFGQYWSATGL